MSGVIIGSEGRKEKLSEAVFGTMRNRQGTYCHVATSPRRDVGSTMQKSTIQPRRDVTTSRRHHVATSTRKSASHHLMRDGSEIRASGGVRTEARFFKSRVTLLLRKFPGFVPLFVFLIFWDIRTMFSVLNNLFCSFIMF